MQAINKTNLLIGLAMLLAALGGVMLKPTNLIADQKPKINLETMIPKQFSEWKIDESIIPLQADPERKALLNKLYNQTLSRTYINQRGDRVMLTIAYGGDQSDAMQVHKPEVCYKAQGFEIQALELDSINTNYGNIPVKKLVAQMGARVEPITYWIKIGDKVAVNTAKWKLEQLKYGLTGKVPDGMLFRVSSIGDKANGYLLQTSFINDLLSSMTADDRIRITGNAEI
jgi:EpsI family protein